MLSVNGSTAPEARSEDMKKGGEKGKTSKAKLSLPVEEGGKKEGGNPFTSINTPLCCGICREKREKKKKKKKTLNDFSFFYMVSATAGWGPAESMEKEREKREEKKRETGVLS